MVRGGDRACLNLEWSLADIESAGALDRGSQFYAFLVKLRVGGLSGKHPRPSTNDEFAFVYNGEVVLTWAKQITFGAGRFGRHSRWREPAVAQRIPGAGADPHRIGEDPWLANSRMQEHPN